MKVEFYAGCGTLKEVRWKGSLDVIPREGDPVHIGDCVYEVNRIHFHLNKVPHVEIYLSGGY